MANTMSNGPEVDGVMPGLNGMPDVDPCDVCGYATYPPADGSYVLDDCPICDTFGPFDTVKGGEDADGVIDGF